MVPNRSGFGQYSFSTKIWTLGDIDSIEQIRWIHELGLGQSNKMAHCRWRSFVEFYLNSHRRIDMACTNWPWKRNSWYFCHCKDDGLEDLTIPKSDRKAGYSPNCSKITSSPLATNRTWEPVQPKIISWIKKWNAYDWSTSPVLLRTTWESECGIVI